MTLHTKRQVGTIVVMATFLLVLSSCQSSQQQNRQIIPQPKSLPKSIPTPTLPSESLYTQDIQEFKSKKYNLRLEGLVGCWLMSKQYLDFHKSNYLFFKDLKLKEIVSLKLVKECMKKVTRKQAILKITELVGKNMEPAKKYEDIIEMSIVDQIFNEVSKLTIANYNQYQPINDEGIVVEQQTKIEIEPSNQNVSTSESSNDPFSAESTSQGQKNEEFVAQHTEQQQTQANKIEELNESQRKSFIEMSEFDHFLVDLIHKYNEEFQKLATSKQGLKGRVQEELKKRQKYYFGIIPASFFSHSVFLVTISLSMVFCCTCFKYYRMRSKESEQRKMKNSEQCDDNCKSHSHGHVKDIKKLAIAKMTQLTMKKKTR